jgi:glycogen synthase
MRKALAVYAQPELFRHYRRNAMMADFSWEQTVLKYLKVYEAAKAFNAGPFRPDWHTAGRAP